jgi:tetrapyrrole methylase family protein/MazG family protein
LHSTITIVGLGYGDPGSRTISAQRALDAAGRIVLRTAVHPGLEELVDDPRVVACDDLYESGLSFADVYGSVVDRVLNLAARGDVVFAIPGSPIYGEQTVRELANVARRVGHAVEYAPAVSGLDAVAVAANLDLLADQVQVLDAAWISDQVRLEPFSRGTTGIDPTRPLVIGQVYSRNVAGDLKHWLSRLFPEDHEVAIVRAAGVHEHQDVTSCRLCELDHFHVDHLTTVVVMPVDALDASFSPATLYQIIACLRSEQGCPWDRNQTHATLRDKVIEEAHEVAEAIDSDEPGALADELGDLMLLVALHAQIAEENGHFTIEDVYHQVNTKLVRRHPHVFGDVVAETPEDVLATWQGIKAVEKEGSQAGEIGSHRFDQLPRSMSVIQRIRMANEFTQTTDRQAFEQSGKLMLETLQRILSQGVDPEAALEWAYRRSLSAPGATFQ